LQRELSSSPERPFESDDQDEDQDDGWARASR
jgi:hypothetical protein